MASCEATVKAFEIGRRAQASADTPRVLIHVVADSNFLRARIVRAVGIERGWEIAFDGPGTAALRETDGMIGNGRAFCGSFAVNPVLERRGARSQSADIAATLKDSEFLQFACAGSLEICVRKFQPRHW